MLNMRMCDISHKCEAVLLDCAVMDEKNVKDASRRTVLISSQSFLITLHCTYLLPAITPAINRVHCIKTGIAAAWVSAVTLHMQGDHSVCDEPPVDFKT